MRRGLVVKFARPYVVLVYFCKPQQTYTVNELQTSSLITTCLRIATIETCLIGFPKVFDLFTLNYNKGLRSSVLLREDCDPEVLCCSVAELSPINAVELSYPSAAL